MKQKSGVTKKLNELRQRAEQELAVNSEAKIDRPTAEYEKLLYELQVHQIELKAQNEALEQAKTLLETSRDEYRNRFVDLYDFAPVGYLTLNSENLITESNLTAASMLGIARSKLILDFFPQWIAEESRDTWLQQFLNLKEYGGKQNCELLMQQSDGSTFNVQVDCVEISNEQTPSVRIAMTDITERKRAERVLYDAALRKDEFLATLAHELRNPLAPISNAVHILKRADANPTRIAWCTDIISRQLEHLVRLVDDLLDVSRISRGVVSLRKEILEIRDFIQPALESSQPLIDSHRQEFALTLPTEPMWVEGDRIRLTQIILNLINNAAKYTQDGGHIRLTVEPAEDKICIRVSDNGSGIDAADLAHLFDLFYQVDRNIDLSKSGLGIGLSLVRSLVEMHGGNICALSPGRGKGSEFVVHLPRLFIPKSTTGQVTASTATDPAQKKLRILLVDDNRDVTDSLALLLKMDGHLVQTTYESPKVLEMVEIEQPDVIILDIGMPVIDGYSLAQALRQNHKLQKTQLIALSGYGQPEDRKKSRAAGFDEHLVKPLDYEILRKLLNKYRATDF